MGYRAIDARPQHHHRKQKPCPRCIYDLEVELGYREEWRP